MTAAAPWLRNEPVPDWRRATVAELVEVWRRLRNSHGAMMAADEIERLRRELAEVQTKYGLLSSAINESTDECGPDCDDYGHGDKCPSLDPERWLIDQQATIEGLRRELAEAERAAAAARGLQQGTAALLAEARRALAAHKDLLAQIEAAGIST